MMAPIGRSASASLASINPWGRRHMRKLKCVRHLALRLLSGAALLLWLCSPGVAADNVSIMVGGIEKQIYLPAKLAERLGYFKEQGLSVELLTEPAGVN